MTKYLKYNLLEYLTAFLFFLNLRPYFTWGTSHVIYMTLLFLILLPNISLREKSNSTLFLLFVLILCIIPVTHGSPFRTYMNYIMFSIVPFLNKRYTLNTFHIFRFLLAIITVTSLLMWLFVVVIQIDIPYTEIAPLNSLKSYNYLSFPFLVIPQMFGEPLSSIRFSCVFDEPGAIGTYSLLILYIGNLNFKKWYNIIFLLAGAISFSLFFYIGLVIFILFRVFTIKSQKKYRYWALVGVALLYAGTQTIPILIEKIGTRIEYDYERGSIVGDNRSNEKLDEYLKSIEGTRAFSWGDSKENVDQFSNIAGLKIAILRYGIVFIVLFFFFYFLYARSYLKGNKVEIILFMLLLFLTLYQRPAFVSPCYLFLFSTVVLAREKEIRERCLLLCN